MKSSKSSKIVQKSKIEKVTNSEESGSGDDESDKNLRKTNKVTSSPERKNKSVSKSLATSEAEEENISSLKGKKPTTPKKTRHDTDDFDDSESPLKKKNKSPNKKHADSEDAEEDMTSLKYIKSPKAKKIGKRTKESEDESDVDKQSSKKKKNASDEESDVDNDNVREIHSKQKGGIPSSAKGKFKSGLKAGNASEESDEDEKVKGKSSPVKGKANKKSRQASEEESDEPDSDSNKASKKRGRSIQGQTTTNRDKKYDKKSKQVKPAETKKSTSKHTDKPQKSSEEEESDDNKQPKGKSEKISKESKETKLDRSSVRREGLRVRYTNDEANSDFSSAESLKSDLSDDSISEDKKNILCKKCNTAFTTSLSLKYHIQKDHKKSFSCVLCKERFPGINGKVYLTNHMKRDHPESKLHPCGYPRCEKSYNKIKQLRDHEKGHYPYICKYCNKGYAKQMQMKEHVRNSHK